MTKKYEVIWAKTAEDDLVKIITYISQDNLVNTLKNIKKNQKTGK